MVELQRRLGRHLGIRLGLVAGQLQQRGQHGRVRAGALDKRGVHGVQQVRHLAQEAARLARRLGGG